MDLASLSFSSYKSQFFVRTLSLRVFLMTPVLGLSGVRSLVTPQKPLRIGMGGDPKILFHIQKRFRIYISAMRKGRNDCWMQSTSAHKMKPHPLNNSGCFILSYT